MGLFLHTKVLHTKIFKNRQVSSTVLDKYTLIHYNGRNTIKNDRRGSEIMWECPKFGSSIVPGRLRCIYGEGI